MYLLKSEGTPAEGEVVVGDQVEGWKAHQGSGAMKAAAHQMAQMALGLQAH